MAHAVSVTPYNQIYHHLLAVRYTNLIQCLRLMTCPEKNAHTSGHFWAKLDQFSMTTAVETNSRFVYTKSNNLELVSHACPQKTKPGASKRAPKIGPGVPKMDTRGQ